MTSTGAQESVFRSLGSGATVLPSVASTSSAAGMHSREMILVGFANGRFTVQFSIHGRHAPIEPQRGSIGIFKTIKNKTLLTFLNPVKTLSKPFKTLVKVVQELLLIILVMLLKLLELA